MQPEIGQESESTRALRPESPEARSWDPRNRMIRSVVKGKTFVDVGGLWGLEGEKVSVALLYGAKSAVMIDLYDANDAAWNLFRERLRAYDIEPGSVQCVSCDFLKYEGASFEVVHSSGMLYHFPNPFIYLERLRRAASQRVILSSLVCHEKITNDQGVFQVPSSGVVFVPALTEEERRVLDAHWKTPTLFGIGTRLTNLETTDFAANWWLPTRHVLHKMCEIAGFTVEDEGDFWNGNAVTLQLACR
jgi:hypothetical protein